jgi:hypothetical protein
VAARRVGCFFFDLLRGGGGGLTLRSLHEELTSAPYRIRITGTPATSGGRHRSSSTLPYV